jgi:hypothetical protein
MKSAVKTNQNAWDKTNAASLTLNAAQTTVRDKMGHNQTGIKDTMVSKKAHPDTGSGLAQAPAY